MRDATQIEAIRQFNRFYARKIGVIGERLLDSEFSLTEGRVVYELAQRDGCAASDIAAALGLDAGYLSRILERLAHKRYLARKVASTDGRRRDLTLTPAGRRAFARIDARSRDDLAAIIAPLDDRRRLELTAAMHTIRQALGDAEPENAPVIFRSHRPGDIGWVVQRHGEISHVEARAERHSKSAGAFDHDAIGSAGQFLIRRTQPREADGHARFVRCDVRRNCGLETIWVRELTRRGDIARCLQRQDVVIHQPVIT